MNIDKLFKRVRRDILKEASVSMDELLKKHNVEVKKEEPEPTKVAAPEANRVLPTIPKDWTIFNLDLNDNEEIKQFSGFFSKPERPTVERIKKYLSGMEEKLKKTDDDTYIYFMKKLGEKDLLPTEQVEALERLFGTRKVKNDSKKMIQTDRINDYRERTGRKSKKEEFHKDLEAPATETISGLHNFKLGEDGKKKYTLGKEGHEIKRQQKKEISDKEKELLLIINKNIENPEKIIKAAKDLMNLFGIVIVVTDNLEIKFIGQKLEGYEKYMPMAEVLGRFQIDRGRFPKRYAMDIQNSLGKNTKIKGQHKEMKVSDKADEKLLQLRDETDSIIKKIEATSDENTEENKKALYVYAKDIVDGFYDSFKEHSKGEGTNIFGTNAENSLSSFEKFKKFAKEEYNLEKINETSLKEFYGDLMILKSMKKGSVNVPKIKEILLSFIDSSIYEKFHDYKQVVKAEKQQEEREKNQINRVSESRIEKIQLIESIIKSAVQR